MSYDDRRLRTVSQPVKIGGRWYRPGTDRDRVALTDAEADAYADSLVPATADGGGAETPEAPAKPKRKRSTKKTATKSAE